MRRLPESIKLKLSGIQMEQFELLVERLTGYFIDEKAYNDKLVGVNLALLLRRVKRKNETYRQSQQITIPVSEALAMIIALQAMNSSELNSIEFNLSSQFMLAAEPKLIA